MEITKEELLAQLDFIKRLIENGTSEDGVLRFDALKCKLALDCTRCAIEDSMKE